MIRRFAASHEGNAAIEFALCASAFFMMLLGIAEFARLMHAYHDMAQGARIGVRYAIVHGAASGAPATASQIASITAASAAISAAEVSVAFSPNNQPGSQITVTIAHPFSFLFGFMPAGPFTLTSHVSQLIAY